MRIVQVNTVCGTGSTGKIAVDLYKIAEEAGHSPYIAYGRGSAPTYVQSFKIGNVIDFGCHVLVNFFLGKSGFGSKAVTKRLLRWLDEVKPDVLHLHNLHGFYLHIGMLFEYIKEHDMPVVWTLHDCWSLTGQCAFFDYAECDKWQKECHDCPVYRTDYPYSLFKDNSKGNYAAKKSVFTGVSNLTIVTPSKWLADIVKKSYLQNYSLQTIYNGINLDIFKPMSCKPICREKLLLGVANVWDHRKGLDYFLQLSNMLDDSFHIVLIGVSAKQQQHLKRKYSRHITGLRRTANQEELAKWYNQAYAYINPTLEDNFPTTNLESLACGTPVITFNTGGSPESLTDKCGIVVDKGNVNQLKEAILSLEKNCHITSEACRNRALEFDKKFQFHKYLQIYASVTSK